MIVKKRHWQTSGISVKTTMEPTTVVPGLAPDNLVESKERFDKIKKSSSEAYGCILAHFMVCVSS